MYTHKHTSLISIECVRLLCAAFRQMARGDFVCAALVLCLCKMAHMRIIESQYQFQYIDLSHFRHKFHPPRNGMIELTF